MAVLWLFERPSKGADCLSQYLIGEFAVRCFASFEAFCILSRTSTIKPNLVLVDAADFSIEMTHAIFQELRKTLIFPFFSLLGKEDSSETFDITSSSRLAFPRILYSHSSELLFLVKQAYLQFESSQGGRQLALNDEYYFDVHAHQISDQQSNMKIELSPKEGRILRLLLSKSGSCVRRQDIEKNVWAGSRVSARTIDSHICRLRKKLEPIGFNLNCYYGRGYRIELSH